MKVKDLIQQLQTFDQEATVLVFNGDDWAPTPVTTISRDVENNVIELIAGGEESTIDLEDEDGALR